MGEQFSFVDLFAGAGGISAGFRDAGGHDLLSVELDARAAETLAVNFGIDRVVRGDLTDPSTHDAIVARVGGREVDVLSGGPPCQAFSVIGRPKLRSLQPDSFLEDPRAQLFREFVTLAGRLRPKVVVMENVRGILSHRDGATAQEVCAEFERVGYRLTAELVNAADFGVPQTRQRVIFIGTRDDQPASGEILIAALRQRRVPTQITVREAIDDLPLVRAGGGAEAMPHVRGPRSEYQYEMRRGSQFVFNHVARRHRILDHDTFSVLRPGGKYSELPERFQVYRRDIFTDKIKRLDPDRPSWTVVSHLYKDGYMFVHPDLAQRRTITVREAARLQSFPDTFFFAGPRTEQFKQVGNAVPPRLAQAIGETIATVLHAGRQYELLIGTGCQDLPALAPAMAQGPRPELSLAR